MNESLQQHCTTEDYIPSLRRDSALGFVLGIITGAAAGLIGVGGGEFRIPVLLHVLRLPVKMAAGVNMVIGLFVVTFGVFRRWAQHAWTTDQITLGLIMAAASLIGATMGVRHAHRFASPVLKRIVCVYLTLVGISLAAVVGFTIAAVSAVIGVAGGEMRIPALMYGFALPVKEAGTLSLMISAPTVAAGSLAYRRLGHVPNRVLAVTMLMGIGSFAGVLVGAALLPFVDKHLLKGLLGAVLLLATAFLLMPGLLDKRSR